MAEIIVPLPAVIALVVSMFIERVSSAESPEVALTPRRRYLVIGLAWVMLLAWLLSMVGLLEGLGHLSERFGWMSVFSGTLLLQWLRVRSGTAVVKLDGNVQNL